MNSFANSLTHPIYDFKLRSVANLFKVIQFMVQYRRKDVLVRSGRVTLTLTEEAEALVISL